MLAAIDGTGPFLDSSYAAKMKNSFVHQIALRAQVPNTIYYRGPDITGSSATGNLIPPLAIALDIRRAVQAGDTTVFLTGYSRGGAMAINVAAILADWNIAIEAMFLFDAVDRSLELSASRIPDNVRSVYHAMRMPSAGSRLSFGNCGTDGSGAREFLLRQFFTTHGGMGGVPWGEAGLAAAVRRAENAVLPCASTALAFPARGRNATPLVDGSVARQLERQRVIATGHIDEGLEIETTNVTVAQERVGMEQVHQWMWWYLFIHGVIA